MSRPPSRTPAPLPGPPPVADVAMRGHAGHQAQVHVDDTRTVAGGAGTLGVRAEEGRLDAVRLGECAPDRVEQPRVGRGIAAPGALDGALIDGHDPLTPRHGPVDERALARPCDPRHHDQHPERDVDVDVPEVVGAGTPHLEATRRPAHHRPERCPVIQVAPGEGSARTQSLDRPLEGDRATRSARSGPQVDDVVSDRDDLRLVLHHEHGVALVAEPQQQPVHALDVVGMEPDRGLVEHVRDIGQRRAQMPDHPGALRLTSRQGAGRSLEAQVPQPDLDERVERLPERRQQRRDRWLVQAPHPFRQVADLHRARIGDVDAPDARGPGGLVQPSAAARRAGAEGHRPFHEGTDVRLERLHVLRQERLLDLGHQALVGDVDARHLDLGGLAVQERPELLLGVVSDGLVRIEEARTRERLDHPAVRGVARHRDGAFRERPPLVVQLREAMSGTLPIPSQLGTCRR